MSSCSISDIFDSSVLKRHAKVLTSLSGARNTRLLACSILTVSYDIGHGIVVVLLIVRSLSTTSYDIGREIVIVMLAFITPLLLAFFAGDAGGVSLDGALGKDDRWDGISWVRITNGKASRNRLDRFYLLLLMSVFWCR